MILANGHSPLISVLYFFLPVGDSGEIPVDDIHPPQRCSSCFPPLALLSTFHHLLLRSVVGHPL